MLKVFDFCFTIDGESQQNYFLTIFYLIIFIMDVCFSSVREPAAAPPGHFAPEILQQEPYPLPANER